MRGDQALEDDGPCRIMESGRQRSEDFADAGLARVGGDEDVLNVLRFRGRGL